MNILIGKIKKTLLLAGDIAVFYLVLFFMLLIRYGSSWREQWSYHFLSFTIIYFFTLAVFYIIGLYEMTLARNNLYFFITLAKALAINAAIAIGLFYFVPYFGIAPKTNLFINLLLLAVFFIGWRQLFNCFIKTQTLLNNILMLGQSQETKELIQYIKDNPQLGYRIKKTAEVENVKILYDLIEMLVQEKIQVVVTTINPYKDANLVRNLYQCIPLKITVVDLPTFYEKITGKIPVSAIEEIWFLQNLMAERKTFFEETKRIIDIFFLLLVTIPALILIPLIALIIKLDSPGPIFFRQKRVGRDNRIFELVKFRSMFALTPDGSAEKSGAQWAKENDKRITRIGAFLRKMRLDELPQLWNILKGDISFVGPRPERPEFAFSNELLSQIPFYQIRHTIKPGLTGWAQIKYPYGASIADTLQKLQYDLYYIKNRSFILDLAIILKTIKIILSGGGR